METQGLEMEIADNAETAAIRAVWDSIPADRADVYGRVFDLMAAARAMYRRLDDGTLVCVDGTDERAEEESYTHTFEVMAILAHVREMLAARGLQTREERSRTIGQIAGWLERSMGLSRLPPGGVDAMEGYCRALRQSHRVRAQAASAKDGD